MRNEKQGNVTLFSKLNLPPSEDAAKAVYIRNCLIKTCTAGPDLELQNSNYMYSNTPLFYTARIPFLKPTWVHKTGGNVHTLYTCIKRQGRTTPS